MSSYATADDLVNCFDAGILGDVASDNGIQVEPTVLAANAKIVSALARASGDVEAACLAGGIYTIDQLGALTGNALAMLVDITCCCAMCKLLRRRPTKSTEELQKGVCGEAKEHLEALRKGQMVFGGTTNATDGMLPQTVGPTTLTFDNLQMMVDRVQNTYPTRRLPNGR